MEIETCETKEHVHLIFDKYKPVVISIKDTFRKGVELDYCDMCKEFQVIIMHVNKEKKYCSHCSLKEISSRQSTNQVNDDGN